MQAHRKVRERYGFDDIYEDGFDSAVLKWNQVKRYIRCRRYAEDMQVKEFPRDMIVGGDSYEY